MYIYIYIHGCMYVCMYGYTYGRMYVCKYVRTYMYACMHVCMHACMHAGTYVCACACASVCVCICICVIGLTICYTPVIYFCAASIYLFILSSVNLPIVRLYIFVLLFECVVCWLFIFILVRCLIYINLLMSLCALPKQNGVADWQCQSCTWGEAFWPWS